VIRRPDIVWPATIIGLLVLSGITTFAVLFASKSDGGAQVVDNYYRRSVAWDSLASAQRASDSLGWHLAVKVGTPTSGHAILSVVDGDGNGVDGLSGSVTVSRPQTSTVFATHSIAPLDSADGQYRFAFPYAEHGLWDLHVRASRHQQQLLEQIRVEI